MWQPQYLTESQLEELINEVEDVLTHEMAFWLFGTVSTIWDKFVLLMWKNALLQYRKPFQTILEVIIPVTLTGLLLVFRVVMAPEKKDAINFTPFCPVQLPSICDQSSDDSLTAQEGLAEQGKRFTLAYSPTGNSAIDKSMGLFKLVFDNVNSYVSEQDMEDAFMTSKLLNTTFAGIVFDDNLKDGSELPDDVEVKIRLPSELKPNSAFSVITNWATDQLFPNVPESGPREHTNNFGAAPEYQKEGFLELQAMLAYFLIFGQLGATKLDDFATITNDGKRPAPMVQMQRYPHAIWIEDPTQLYMPALLAFALVVSFFLTFSKTVTTITIEKERQLKETMKMMGLSNWLHWTAWFCRSFIILLTCVVLNSILLTVPCSKGYGIFTFANPFVIFLFLLLVACSIITLAFLTSVFFSKANRAATFSGLFLIISYAPFMFLPYSGISLSVKILASLGSATAMAYGVRLMLMFERTGEGIQWQNVLRPSTQEDSLTLGHVMLMLIVDTFLYLFVALYADEVFPGEYGVQQPWNYLFTRNYWKGQPTEKDEFPAHRTDECLYLEEEPDLEMGVQIINLRKVFGHKVAVRNLSLNLYRDQITVLLGHNGAGKTCVMSMLTGMYPPTSGTATVAGHDIRTDMDGARLSLGLCPQKNILFDDLTVKEHLVFYTKLKGLEQRKVDRDVRNFIRLLGLSPKTNAKSSTLSGGTKRKLCVAIAMCGYSKVVMLDEPTAGMDPSARRAIWELIQRQKGGRTILLTTHFMDEADLLGDRIAIMADGALQCCGSSFFLKKMYGTGYRLIIDKSDVCVANRITRTLKTYIPSIEIHSNAGSELTYLLDDDDAEVFEDMLSDLEENSAHLGIRSYGISLTTLEEVFMKVGADHSQEASNYVESKRDHKSKSKDTTSMKKTKSVVIIEESTAKPSKSGLLSGGKLIRNQFLAMGTKRFFSLRHNWLLLLLQFLLPVGFMIGTFSEGRFFQPRHLPELELSPKSYTNPITLVENAVDDAKEIHDVYVDLLTSAMEKIEKVASIPDVMMNYTAIGQVKRRYIVGASFNSTGQAGSANPTVTVTAWFNNQPFHSPPLALALALSSVYKYMLKKTIRFVNYPLPFIAKTEIDRLTQYHSRGNQVATNLVFALAFVSGFHVLFYVRERVCKNKHLQLVSGVKICVFWLCAFLFDFAIYLMICLVIVVTIACFQEDGYKTPADLGRFSVLLLYYVVAVLPLIYLASFWCDVPSTVLGMLVALFVMIGVFVCMLISLFGLEHKKMVDSLHLVLLFEPHYSLATGIRDTYVTHSTDKMCRHLVQTCTKRGTATDVCRETACQVADVCCEQRQNYFRWKSTGIGKNLCYSFGIGTTMFLLLLTKESRYFAWLANVCTRHRHVRLQAPDSDSDVEEENRVIGTTNMAELRSNYAIVLRNVTKHYGRKLMAVNGICLGIKRYECFGLLGANGAGKTTTFRMMTGDAKMSSGDVWINGFNVKTQLGKVYENIGYCPQFDALLDDLTAKETLVMFALLRGVPRDECANLVAKVATDFDFRECLNEQIRKLSGGNKRKVSTAISMIGDPPVVFLDEPTAGMDPATKRHLWNVLCRARDSGKCLVLTSHSMEECQALCTRLVMMVRGHFKCLGTAQHLKNKFAAGYTLTIKVAKTSLRDDGHDTQQVEDFVKSEFPSAELKEKHQEMLTYNIVDKSVPWSRMFGILEKAKEELDIEDYSLGQSSLEQVFLSFTDPKMG